MSAEFMFITFILFLAGVIAVPLASRFGLGSVLGYLIAGIAIGPILRWAGVDIVEIQHFTEFGVVMMLFIVGLEMKPSALWELRNRIFILGGLQVTLTTVAVMGLAMMFGLQWSIALAIGLVFALSSTAIVNQTLNEKGLMRSDGGQASFSVLLFQDMAVIPILAFAPLLALPHLMQENQSSGNGHGENSHNSDSHGSDSHASSGDGHGTEGGLNLNLVEGLDAWTTTGITLAAIAAVIIIGMHLTGPVFREVARANLRELFVSAALMFVVGIALLMTMVGVSPALGTFLAGVVMANSPYRHELESDITPFKGIFLGVFFITVGASINFELLTNNLSMVLGLTFGLILLKSAVLLLLSYIFKIKGADRWLFTLGLAQAGEFGFVLISFMKTNAVLPGSVEEILLLIVALTMLLTPLLFIIFDKVIAPRFSAEQMREPDEIKKQSKIILAGHGRFGSIVNRTLRAAGYDITVVDYNHEQLEMLKKFGFGDVFYGDATRPDLLLAAGIEEAEILVIAIDGKAEITELARYVHEHYPHVHVIARAIDRWHVYDLWFNGCRDIIRETYDSSVRATRSVFEAMGYSRDKATRMMAEFEQADRDIMVELAHMYDPDMKFLEDTEYAQVIKQKTPIWEEELRQKLHAIRDEEELVHEDTEDKLNTAN